MQTFVKPHPPKFCHKETPAVHFESAFKSYASFGNEGVSVLNNFHMNIQQGTIYSLLGSSGCGKTTVLSSIVGLKRLDTGTVEVFGGRPGSRKSCVPGRKVGYMPQELSLYGEFTIDEVFQYFGTIFAMNTKEILETTEFLIKFLDLPHASRQISTLSGGQKRRVSLAASLLHNPQLLVLDEPTVGVDPLLRESIWTYLVQLVAIRRTTVLITTHYIEEARRSHVVGLMRHGKLLVEDSPHTLMKMYNVSLLEDVVLKLCEQDNIDSESKSSPSTSTSSLASEIIHPIVELSKYPDKKNSVNAHFNFSNDLKISKNNLKENENKDYNEKPVSTFRESLFRLKALVRKNACLMIRNPPYLLFVLFLPVIQMIILCLTIGNSPHGLKLGLVNYDSNLCDLQGQYSGCIGSNLSCRFLQTLVQSDNIYLVSYENENHALHGARQGDTWGFITFPTNFSTYMIDRFIGGNYASNETLDGSTILLDLDLSNSQVGLTMKRVLFETLQKFTHGLLSDCDYDTKLGDPPLKLNPPIYGNEDASFREFTAPSTLLGILFFMPICSSSISLILDKRQGTLDRSIVAGVKAWETMVSYFLTEGCVLVAQSVLSFLILILAFSIEVQGSITLAISLAILVGVCGLSMGFLFASFCNDILEAIILAMGSFFPNFLLSGMIWPMQGMPLTLQYISYVLPCTLAGEALRSIVSRGWGFTHPNVWPGFVATTAWICFYWVLNLLVQKLLARKRAALKPKHSTLFTNGSCTSGDLDSSALSSRGSWKFIEHD